jgi:glycosyltransferase involved in cell wall biosynthesis
MRSVPSSDRRRVALVSLTPLRPGQGQAVHVDAVRRGLVDRGWQVFVLAPPPEAGRIAAALDAIRLQAQLWRRRRSFDAIYVRHHPLSLPTSLWSGRERQWPRVEEVNGAYEDFAAVHRWAKWIAGLLRRSGRRVLASSSHVVVVSTPLRDYVRALVPRPLGCTVVSNGVHLESFRPGVEPLLPELQPYVVFVGSLSPWQGLKEALAAPRSPQWPGGLRLVIVGDGQLRAAVEAAATAVPGVVYLGALSHDRLPGVYAGAAASLVLKTGAGWHQSPLKLYESLAAGVPVVIAPVFEHASACLETGCAEAVPRDFTASDVAAAVRRLTQEPSRRADMSAAARDLALRAADWNDRFDVLSSLLDRAMTDGFAEPS